ncbi:hypothetical protein HPP92_021008 [Vanilla planifolia]|uniref:Nudix hydrolase domain-containing protein n=1 Tax=Vanilla planifolia TaxID=51239 RepID=A0A835UI44_VANPL|nr:hypothetical protein HPP92_021008 [Vanilla planifolia]
MSAPDHSYRLMALIERLRFYKPVIGQVSGEETVEVVGVAVAASAEGGDRDLNDRGKVFSSIVLPESVSSSQERFFPKRAAVLICLFEDGNGDLRVLLTKRSSSLSTHSGEVSLPGGKAESGDADDRETATREAKEEIGLDPSLVTVVAVLEPFLSKHLLQVVPVIGVLINKKAFIPSPNAAEVEAVFDAPLDMFLKDDNHRSEERQWMGENYLLHYFTYESNGKEFLIWGLTASILIHAASVVYQQQPSFPERKPRFRYPTHIHGKLTME